MRQIGGRYRRASGNQMCREISGPAPDVQRAYAAALRAGGKRHGARDRCAKPRLFDAIENLWMPTVVLRTDRIMRPLIVAQGANGGASHAAHGGQAGPGRPTAAGGNADAGGTNIGRIARCIACERNA